MKKLSLVLTCLCLLVCVNGAFGVVGQVWNIPNDWDGSATLPPQFGFSHMNHINGTSATAPLPVTNYIANWHSPHLGIAAGGTVEQPAFVPAAGGTEPGFAKVVNDNPNTYDLLIGDLVSHGQGSIDWTSPITGQIKVDATAWGIGGTPNGHDLFILEDGIFNGDALDHFIGNFGNHNSSRANPLSGTETFNVTAGQVVRVWIRSGSATFWGMSANIEHVPEPATITMLGLGLGAILRRRSKRAHLLK